MEVVDVESGAVDIIGKTVKVLVDCKKKGEILRKQVRPSIYMVPSALRDLNPSSFTPKVVSIGPLHKEDENLQRFESDKLIYLHNLLAHLGVEPEETMRECTKKVIHSIERIKACYSRSTTNDDFELAMMMVIDGCFILEFIQSYFEISSELNMLIFPTILSDLLLMENQIPFFVLEDIFQCTFVASGRREEGTSVITLIKKLVGAYKIFESNFVVPDVRLASTPDHILGLVHKYYQPVEPIPSVLNPSVPKGHSAMELDRAGMKFKPNKDLNWALAIKFEVPKSSFSWFSIFTAIPQFSWLRWRTLRMPVVVIHDFTELIVRNLLVYEQSSNINTYVSSYVFAMDMLIDTPEDVAVLVKSKVLTNLTSSNENVANIINSLRKTIGIPRYFYEQQWKEMDAYYNSYWPNTLAGLKRKYFSNPWSINALIAAFVLFALTVVQTIFTIKAAYSTNGTK